MIKFQKIHTNQYSIKMVFHNMMTKKHLKNVSATGTFLR
jgi:hypothetical protein